jgi:hypothetical protein
MRGGLSWCWFSVSEVPIISTLATLCSLSRVCGGGLGWGKAASAVPEWRPHPTLPREERERE